MDVRTIREGNILKFYTFTKKSFLAALSLFCLVACSGGQSLDNQSYSRANEAADKRINVFSRRLQLSARVSKFYFRN